MTDLATRCRRAAENWLDPQGEIPELLRECAEALESMKTHRVDSSPALTISEDQANEIWAKHFPMCVEDGMTMSKRMCAALQEASLIRNALGD